MPWITNTSQHKKNVITYQLNHLAGKGKDPKMNFFTCI